MRTCLLVFCVLSCVLTSRAQTLELPRKSPQASVRFTVGLTEVNIRYSSPAVRGREVWGDLVPYDQIWRAGANEASVISFSHDVLVEGQALAAGEYAFFLLPHAGHRWTAIFNRHSDQWGAYDYSEENDVLRVEIPVDTLCDPEERLQYYLSDTNLDEGTLCLRWERYQTCLRFQVPVMDQIHQRLEAAVQQAEPGQVWNLYAQVADFLSAYDTYWDEALTYAIQSTSRFDHSWNWWLRAQLESRLGDYRAAVRSAERSLSAGKANPQDQFYLHSQTAIQEHLSNWRRQAK